MFPLGDLIGETNEALYRGFRDYSKDNLYAGAMLGRTPFLGDWLHGMEALTTQYLGGMGLFVAILVGLISTWIYNLCVKKNIVIKMPDQVPPFLAEGFSSIIPLALSVLLQLVISVLIFNFTGVGLSEILIGLFSTLMNFGTSLPAMLIIGLICGLFWIFGFYI